MPTMIELCGDMGRPRSNEKRTARLVAPASDREVREYVAACAKLQVEPADTLRKLARALIFQAEEHGWIVQPLKIAPPPLREEELPTPENPDKPRKNRHPRHGPRISPNHARPERLDVAS